jgi:hypothetical protein
MVGWPGFAITTLFLRETDHPQSAGLAQLGHALPGDAEDDGHVLLGHP